MLSKNIKDPSFPAEGCIIWLHGLGADGSDMAGLAIQPQLAQLPFRHVFLDAPVRQVTLNAGIMMRAWYDIYGLKITDREDKEGISNSYGLILDVLKEQLAAGFMPQQIFLAGFSQGGAMALYTGLHADLPLAGIVALSSYLPLSAECDSLLPKESPIFMSGGVFDPIVLPDWTRHSETWLKEKGYTHINWHQYPREHTICLEEIQDLAQWFLSTIKGAATL